MGIISKKVRGLVDVKEHTRENCWCRSDKHNQWAGQPTYLIRYENCNEPGAYIPGEFLPSEETQKEIEDALAELEYQAAGLEFPTQ